MLLKKKPGHRGSRDDARRRELRLLLQTRRAQLSPAEMGLPVGDRRRGAGLRQEDVAMLAGLSTRWYAAFERGEVAAPHVQVLEAVARVLRMDEADRTCLYLLAVGHEPGRRAPEAPARVDEDLAEFVRGQESNPAMLTDLAWNVLCHNPAAGDWFGDFENMPEADRNMVLWLFTEEAAEKFSDIDAVRRETIGELRAEYARCPGAPAFDELITRLLELSPRARELWGEYQPSPAASYFVRRIRHARYGWRNVVGVSVQIRTGLRLLVFMPAHHGSD
ncbi:transcriptional regulator [Longimycelium tulufanense]|uniref:Transcriptional regulator n=2 Tax=Longimycelium tulufanense TaxID=907463 RepID=A0A8J3FY20_9PSEU|nr:transcriptional regulator [Longimycelium tulufanense]